MARLIPNQSLSASPVGYIDKFRGTEVAADKQVQALEMFAKLRQHALPELYAEVIVLRFVEGCSWKEIARELNMPHKLTAYMVCKRAIQLLRERGYR